MLPTPSFLHLLLRHDPSLSGWGGTDEIKNRLIAYLERLWRANQNLNLFSRRLSPQALVDDHLMDSLLALPHLARVSEIADLGTGGGFPAIPLAIFRPEAQFHLYEKSVLKRRFLHGLKDLCPNIQLTGKIEDTPLPPDTGLVIARAFKPLRVILALTEAYGRRGGAYLLYKGRYAKIIHELAEAGLSPQEVAICRLAPTGTAEERHLLLVGSKKQPPG